MALFETAFTEASTAGMEHNDCIKAGWASVKEAGWQPPSTGKKWVLVKAEPGGGDVHVQRPTGGKKPEECDDEGKDKDTKKFETASTATVLKVDDTLGLVFGWAIVSKQNGADYYDTQGDHIPEDAMLKAADDFMQNSRVAKDMHAGDAIGSVVFCWPMTSDIAKAMGITTTTTGLMIAMKPPADIVAKFKSGEYTGFSIGGERGVDEEVA